MPLAHRDRKHEGSERQAACAVPASAAAAEWISVWAPVVLSAAAILIASGESFAALHTGSWLAALLRLGVGEVAPETFRQIHSAVRKSAHLIEYGVFGVLLRRGVQRAFIARAAACNPLPLDTPPPMAPSSIFRHLECPLPERKVGSDNPIFLRSVRRTRIEGRLLGAIGKCSRGAKKLNISSSGRLSARWQVAVWLIPCVLAVVDEARQFTLPSRTGSIRDVGIDTLGAWLGLIVWSWRAGRR